MAAVDNIKDEPYTVEPGQRLFQLVAMDGTPIHFELVSELQKLVVARVDLVVLENR